MKLNKLLKPLLVAILLALLPQTVAAYDFMVDGLFYNYNYDYYSYSTSVTVTYDYSSSISGDITIPETVTYNGTTYSVTSIGDNAFNYSYELTSVIIPNSVTSIGDNAFSGCSNLTSVTIPNSVTSIGYSAFSGCYGLASVTIGNSVNTIGNRAFENCNRLAQIYSYIENPANVTMGSSVFYNVPISTCFLDVPIGTIGSYKSANQWKDFTHIVEMEGPEHIHFADFYVKQLCVANWDTDGDGKISYEEAAAVTDLGSVFKYNYNYRITSFDELQYFTGLSSIGYQAFYDCSGLTSVTIPNSVTSIGGEAFFRCSNLTAIEIPNTVTYIGIGAFHGCSGLTSVTIPDCVSSINGETFYGCSGLTSVTIPNSVTSINYRAFRGCSGLTSVTIPSTVTFVDYTSFCECSGLESLVVESGNPTYDSRGDCNAIIETASNTLWVGCNNTIIPNTVTAIYHYAFYGSGLTSVTIPNSVVTIGDESFYGCKNLEFIEIPETLYSIGCYSFHDTKWFQNQPDGLVYLGKVCVGYKGTMPSGTSVVVSDGTIAIAGDTFYNFSNLTGITMPSSIIEIGKYAFMNCSGLTSVVIPSSTTIIGPGAFLQCPNLTSLVIPSNVSFIGGGAFHNCSGLNDIYSYIQNPSNVTLEYTNTFEGVPKSSCTLHVPVGTAALYRTAAQWRYFTNIVDDIVLPIHFADSNVKQLCVANWDTDGDGELSYEEAAAVTNLGSVFSGNTTITSFDEMQYFTGLTSINDMAFDRCSSFTSITIPSSVISIGSQAFRGCNGLTSVTIPNSVTSIGDNAFSGCNGLTSVTIPHTVTSIGNQVFSSCKVLESIVVESGNTTYDSRDNCNAIIETASNKLIVGCKNTTIPNTVTSIGSNAFYYCSGLTSVTIPNSVTAIGDDAFYYCQGLTSVTIPNTVTSIGHNAFYGCI